MDGDRIIVDGNSSSLVDGNKTHFIVTISSDNNKAGEGNSYEDLCVPSLAT